MSAKTTTPEQHKLLHQYWPNDCCLCTHEAKVKELEEKVKELEKRLSIRSIPFSERIM